MAPEVILTDWNKSLDKAKLLGHDYLIVPSLPSDTAKSLDRWKYWADQFNIAGAAARKTGIWLAFHNEPDHMKALGGAITRGTFYESTAFPSEYRGSYFFGDFNSGNLIRAAFSSSHEIARVDVWGSGFASMVQATTGDDPAGRGPQGAGDALEEGRLARAVVAQQGEGLALGHLERHVVERVEDLVGVAADADHPLLGRLRLLLVDLERLGDVLDRDGRLAHTCTAIRSPRRSCPRAG